MTSAESRENRYRYGVLEGNHVEDRYGLDLHYGTKPDHWPKSTMQADYQWYNSVLFNQRDELTENWPKVRDAINKDNRLKHLLHNEWEQPDPQQEGYNKLKEGTTMLEKEPPIDSNKDPNKFTQYGGWILESKTTRDPTKVSMYNKDTCDEHKQVCNSQDPGDQEASCRKHLLFGHGLKVDQFRNGDYRTITSLAYNDKAKP